MKIDFATIDEFCDELRITEDRSLFDDTVRVQITREPLQREGVTHRVCFRASAIVILNGGDDGAGSEFLAELGLAAGIDDETGDYGTAQAEAWKSKLETTCEECGLNLRPGRIEA